MMEPPVEVRARLRHASERTVATEQTRELAQFQRAMVDRFDGYLPPLLRGKQRFFADTEIPYIPYYSFEERVAARERDCPRTDAMR